MVSRLYCKSEDKNTKKYHNNVCSKKISNHILLNFWIVGYFQDILPDLSTVSIIATRLSSAAFAMITRWIIRFLIIFEFRQEFSL
jgi:hypothetical protein